ncbi:MAG: hybrid sensor histidine kinase/response regulator transcription factor, partial [Saprospiraceae bacterium]|nr:hybrid sensor histidine kinase/response regulator transcription factor [Saprospiraceae bacterium]
NHHIWMSSNKGIIRLDPATGNITNFVEADGLQSSEFNTFAYTSTPNGQLLFGGIYGLNAFHPDELSINQTTAAPLLTGLEINNIRITARDSTGILDQALEFTSSITLPHGQNNITLHFVSPEFTAPFENRYRYYLQGAEDPWVHETTDNQAAYLNLRPGNYTFFLAASNSDEVWSEAITQLHIEIVPPWYLSNLAYVVYFLLLGLTAWWVVRVRESRMRMRHDIAMKQQETARLRELDQVKSQLYTNITHEFRTPLTVISGIADEMEAAPEHKALIKRNSEQLLDLVNQMLDLRKLESGSMTLHMEQADGIAFLRYVVDAFAALASAKGLSLAFSSNVDELVLDIDRHKWTRVMSNLLSNAIKFTPHGGHVQVHVEHRLMKDSEQLDITVEDSGLGIPESGLVHIFDRFYQVDNSSTRAGEGTGVGLSLVSEMVHLLGGEIQVSSAPGVGTAFCVQLPVSRDAPLVSTDTGPVPVYTGTAAEVPDKDPAPAMTTTADSALPRLLMIEDSPDVATYLVSCLQGMYNLEIARDGRAGIAKAIESVPDIIISDVMMPFADGFEVCNTLKTDARTSHIPIILLTAKADIQSRIEGLKRGADAYIAKPFHKQELLVELQKLIALRKLLQARYQSHDPPEPTDDPGTQLEDAFILRFRDVVEAHLDDADFDVAALCKAMGSSRSQLHRKITALTGMSTAEFQRSIRLHRAKELLLGSDMNVSEIAYEVGFRDPNYFTKAFSAAFGLTPSRFRSEVHT